MAGRSLQASPEGIRKAQAALTRHSFSQAGLAAELGISRQPVSKFFHGKPVDRSIFVEICEELDLNWGEVVASNSHFDTAPEKSTIEIDHLVITVREKICSSLQKRCGSLRVLDMTQPIALLGEQGLYTPISILETLTERRRLEITDPLLTRELVESEPFAATVSVEQAVQHYNSLMVLGKPGSGKTTLLKYLALRCLEGQLFRDRVPLLIRLKDFAETEGQPSLVEYIVEQLAACEIQDSNTAQQLLVNGRLLLLLDGLDEVRRAEFDRVLREVRQVSEHFHANSFIITCRIAASEYAFEQFIDVEIADFNLQQTTNFVHRWFSAKQQPEQAEKFLLHLKQNPSLQELSTNPLLLAFLCQVFEAMGNFPAHRAELYSESIEILLRTWDATRHIQRNHPVENWSAQHTLNLLTQIAVETFEQDQYIFKQTVIEQAITTYLRTLPDNSTDLVTQPLDSKTLLSAIVAHHGLLIKRAHGVYSFSHRVIHEFLAARKIISGEVFRE